jgi:hypothetical protein
LNAEGRSEILCVKKTRKGIEPFPAFHGDIYRVRAMDVNTPVD